MSLAFPVRHSGISGKPPGVSPAGHWLSLQGSDILSRDTVITVCCLCLNYLGYVLCLVRIFLDTLLTLLMTGLMGLVSATSLWPDSFNSVASEAKFPRLLPGELSLWMLTFLPSWPYFVKITVGGLRSASIQSNITRKLNR